MLKLFGASFVLVFLILGGAELLARRCEACGHFSMREKAAWPHRLRECKRCGHWTEERVG